MLFNRGILHLLRLFSYIGNFNMNRKFKIFTPLGYFVNNLNKLSNLFSNSEVIQFQF